MPNYTKLFNSIITSTIWSEDDKTRIIWITMLAIADQNGEVQGSIPGLARIAGVSIEDTEAAINKFLKPDQYSRTPEFDGRRICKIEGGWELLNHAKYRRMASLADKKDANIKRQKRHREREITVTPERYSNTFVTPKSDIAEAEADTEDKELNNNTPKGRNRSELNSELSLKAESIYNLYPRKIGKIAAIKSILKSFKYCDYEKLTSAVRSYAESTKDKENRFIPYPATWFNDGRYNDDPKEWDESKTTKNRFAGIQEEIELP